MWLPVEEQRWTKHTKVSSCGYTWVIEDALTLCFYSTGSTVKGIKPGKGELVAHWKMLSLH